MKLFILALVASLVAYYVMFPTQTADAAILAHSTIVQLLGGI